jgi:hypothetical protein
MPESQSNPEPSRVSVAFLLGNGGRTRLIRLLLSLGLLAAAFSVTVDLFRHDHATSLARGEIWDMVGTAVLLL